MFDLLNRFCAEKSLSAAVSASLSGMLGSYIESGVFPKGFWKHLDVYPWLEYIFKEEAYRERCRQLPECCQEFEWSGVSGLNWFMARPGDVHVCRHAGRKKRVVRVSLLYRYEIRYSFPKTRAEGAEIVVMEKSYVGKSEFCVPTRIRGYSTYEVLAVHPIVE